MCSGPKIILFMQACGQNRDYMNQDDSNATSYDELLWALHRGKGNRPCQVTVTVSPHIATQRPFSRQAHLCVLLAQESLSNHSDWQYHQHC